MGGDAHDLRGLQILRWYGTAPPQKHHKIVTTKLICDLGGFFRAHVVFPSEYPLLPPKMTFQTPIFHPNSTFYAFRRLCRGSWLTLWCLLVYASGDVCISILHPPEDDKYGYEQASERWSPVQTPETILLSVISLLSSPNDESPANIEAARLWREDPKEFRKRCRTCVRKSLGED